MVTNLKSQTRQAKLFEIILLTLLGVLMYVSQVIMSQLPNIEIVSLLIIITTCVFGVKAVCSVYIFVICEIFTYGLGIWTINYLYVWAILWFTILLFRKNADKWTVTLVSAIFGLSFDVFCSIPYFFIGGIGGGLSYIVAGFWFNILHCIGNFTVAFLLFEPLKRILENTINKYR